MKQRELSAGGFGAPGQKWFHVIGFWIVWLASSVWAEDFAALCADRAAVERVYHNHRLGDKPPFDQVLPWASIERLVRDDQHKQSVLKRVYGVEITPPLLDAEVQRINATTRAPAVLAELKAALGNNVDRFARSVAQPIVVERLLKEKFLNDDTIHVPQRRQAEQLRDDLLKARQSGANPEALRALMSGKHSNSITEVTWQLADRPAITNQPGTDQRKVAKESPLDRPVLVSPSVAGNELKFYFGDLPGELQRVLHLQLSQPGDLSAVIEMPNGFLLYLAREKTHEVFKVAVFSLPKRNYDEWLQGQ